ncbi:MAG: phosphoenolpyruvate--protein phosphotransferase [Armatimonadota bacterium]
MSLEYTFICPLPNGLHARPASLFAEVVKGYKSRASLINERNGHEVNAASVLDLISADIRNNDRCCIRLSGDDEEKAHAAVVEFIKNTLPQCDEPLPETKPQGEIKIPRLLNGLSVSFVPGDVACAGIGIGKAVSVECLALQVDDSKHAESPAVEHSKVESAINSVRSDIERLLSTTQNSVVSGVLCAHLAIVDDIAFLREINSLIDGGMTAGKAVAETVETFAEEFETMENEYLRERAIDIRDIGLQLLESMNCCISGQQAVILTEPSVLVAKSLAPRQLLELDRKQLRGLILEQAGATSHAVILARSFGIPTITGIPSACTQAGSCDIVVDADRGMAVFPVDEKVRRFYEREIVRTTERRNRFLKCTGVPVTTKDGARIEIAANIATGSEVEDVIANGAEGIGLFRTEMLFSERPNPPSEQEQFEIYSQVARAMAGKSVVIRTLDAGGDKPLPHLNQTAEENPFLGCRGIRLYQDNIEIITNQIRAIVRASAHGRLKIMAPMVSSVDEAKWFRELIRDVQASFDKSGIEHDPDMHVGVMVEVPSAAMMIDKLCDVVDFFSIGTNDLCQYFLAAERGNPKVSSIYNEKHPAFLRLLKSVVDSARGLGKWVGVCGEMAGKVENMPLLAGLGLDEISLSVPNIPAVRDAVSSLNALECRQLLESAVSCASALEVESLLGKFNEKLSDQPLFDANLIVSESDSRSKEEAIKELADLLYITGRTDACDGLEDAIWAREAMYSTGLGYGFAIPHCKTDILKANSLAVLKLKEPVEWGSIDNQPVSFVILLAMRESDKDNSHMRIFSVLARKLMDEDFRQQLISAKDRHEMLACLISELNPPNTTI